MATASGNAFVFRFESTNALLRQYLNTAERARVLTWQPVGSKWKIELHPGHPQGEPFYIRLDGNTDNENVPKVDTKNHTAANYTAIGSIKNYQKLRAELTETEQTALLNFIRASWPHLTLIAQRYWSNTLAPPDPPPPTARPATKACTATPRCTGVVQNVVSGKAPCSVCFKYQ
jgi:hypothetical protein